MHTFACSHIHESSTINNQLEEKVRATAQKIADKQVKNPSPVINSIKNKMRNLLDELDNTNDSLQ